MRVLAVSAFVLAVFVSASSAVCMKPMSNLYPMASACPAYAACGAAFCGCNGVTTNTNASTCLAGAATATCASITPCMLTYQTCLARLSMYSANSSSPCFLIGSAIQVATVAAATTGFANSTLQKSCNYRACTIMNASATTCTFGAMGADVCVMPMSASTPAPTAPTGTLPAGFEAAIFAQVRIEGSAFGTLLTSNKAGLETAVTTDLAGLMQVSTADVRVTNMVLGSLVVSFAVSAAAGVQPSVLNDRLAAAVGGSWLTSTQSVYSTVSNETLRVTSAPVVLSSAAPGTVTDAPATTTAAGPSPGSPSAAVVSAFAAVMAVAAAVVAL